MRKARYLLNEVFVFLKWAVVVWLILSWVFMVMAPDAPQSPLYLPIEKELHFLFIVFPIISIIIAAVGRILDHYSGKRN